MTNSRRQAPIAVIGGSVSGLVCGGSLASLGHDVTILEKREQPGAGTVCGGGFARAVVEDIGLDLDIPRVAWMELSDWEGERLARMRADAYGTLPRTVLDKALGYWAASRGAVIRMGAKSAVVNEEKEGVDIVLENGERIQSRYAVYADGPRTMARGNGIGCPVTPETIVALSWRLRAHFPADLFHFTLAPALLQRGYFWLFGKGEWVNAGVGTTIRHARTLHLSDLLEDFIQKRLGPCECLKKGSGLIPVAMPKRVATTRTAVVGDAAGMVNPITGGGIFFAVRGAQLLARAIDESIRRGMPLDTVYRRMLRRSPVFTALRLTQALYPMIDFIPYDVILTHYFRLSSLLLNRFIQPRGMVR